MRYNLQEILKQNKAQVESLGHKVAYICVCGSQNYGLDIYNDEYQSDVDTKAVIVPTLEELIYNSKPKSTVVNTPTGQCDIKDIRMWGETLVKANPQYIETLYTKYFIIDDDFQKEMQSILDMKDDFVDCMRFQMLRGMYGMSCEKYKALCHPYPSIIHKIEKWGYDGKQLSHIARLYYMAVDYFVNGKNLAECLYPTKEHKEEILLYKNQGISLDEAKEKSEYFIEKFKIFKDNILETALENAINYFPKEEIIHQTKVIIKNKIIKDIKNG